MKMVMVVYSSAADDDILEHLKEHGLSGYTKLKSACGVGSETEPKLRTHTWPGDNNVLFIAAEDDQIERILKGLCDLKKMHARAGIRGFVMPLTEIV
jgi:nitrogen regulatory protein PII